MARMRPIAAALLLSISRAAIAQNEPKWQDPSPHTVRFIEMEKGVQLEVLDWGGSGSAVVLLAGLGVTAHQYDDIAPALAKNHRVVGVTRRGHRGSSAAEGGFELPRLAEDVIRVMDVLAINNPVVVGHSFAGEELHVLGARHAARIRGLVYVDGAFSHGDDVDTQALNAMERTVPRAPAPSPAELASPADLRTYLDKYGNAGPEGYLRTRYRISESGAVGRQWAPEPLVLQAMTKAIQEAFKSYKPEPIRVPALAVYAVPKSADDLMRRGSSNRFAFPELATRAAEDPALRDQVEKLFLFTRARVSNHERWFQGLAEGGRVAELSGTHDLIFDNSRAVLELIEAFVSSLPAIP